MIFDFKCNETGVSCNENEPKKLGPVSFGPNPIDRPASEVFGSIFTFSGVHEILLAKSIHKNSTMN